MPKEILHEREKVISKSLLQNFISFLLVTFALVAVEILMITPVKSVTEKMILTLIFVLVDIGAFIFVIERTKRKARSVIEAFLDENARFESILDAVPSPIHVTDKDMKWTYMNKAFEDLLVTNGAIKDRKSSYGLACSNANANICKTENCGINQLIKHRCNESYFDWHGSKCKQETAAIKDRHGNDAGFVEIVTDLTSILSVNEYAKIEIARLSENLDLIANGNLNVNLEVTEADQYSHEMMELFSQINVSIKKVADSIMAMDGEAVKLIDAGLVGNLSLRGDLSNLHGIYAQIVQGFNQTFDAFKEPLDVASNFIEKLANGEDLGILDNVYKGYYAKLIANLNSVRESLYFLLSESARLAEEGKKGNLTARGDLTKLKGGFAHIIEGINETLESIVVPLNESFTVLGKMSNNDLTTQMSQNYNGMLGEFAEAVNQVGHRLYAIEKIFINISKGDVSQLDYYEKIGKRSENDNMVPAMIAMMQNIKNLITDANRLADAAIEGNLQARGDQSRFEGGYAQIIVGLNRTMEAVTAPIAESAKVLQALADGNLTVEMNGDYKGDYNRIKTAMNTAIHSFNTVLNDINMAADQVAVGSKQVSDGSQALSQGATEQASAIEQLTSSIAEIAAQTKDNAMNAAKAHTLSLEAEKEAIDGNDRMNQMLESMRAINESSSNISKIIKVIDDIAFQTNILALNAAVEAARAGQYGKGFAVVAEEVRNLAAKSADAAKNTTALIEGSIGKVEAGTKIANDTASKLASISGSVKNASALIEKIASASNEQATAVSQIDQGLSQVSTVVQTNSATSEESAASSEELSSQAEMLKEQINKFKLQR
jgi:methyl-accepting chemotaxis protein